MRASWHLLIQAQIINRPRRGLDEFVELQCWLVLRASFRSLPCNASWFPSQLWSLQSGPRTHVVVVFFMESAKL